MTTAHFTDAERRITIIGVMIVFLLSALDQTIVSTAMPVIISQLHGLELYAWVTTAYLLSSTVMVPMWGKLGDLYGRKPVLLAGIGLFLLGSWLSGLAGEFGTLPLLGGGMVQLIVFRAIQGLGGGALFTTAFAIIADLFPPRERGKFAGLFGGVFGLASAVGPLLGGYFTDHGTVSFAGHTIEGWRWVFYLNLPVGLIALFMVIAKMPKLSHAAKGSIDYLGAVLIVAACVPLLLALTFGGQKYRLGLADSDRIVRHVPDLHGAVCDCGEKSQGPDHPYGTVRQQGVHLGQHRRLLFVDVLPQRGRVSALVHAARPGRAGHDQRAVNLAPDDRLDCGGDVERTAGYAHRPLQAIHACRNDRAADCDMLDESDDLSHDAAGFGLAHGNSRRGLGSFAEPVQRRHSECRADEPDRGRDQRQSVLPPNWLDRRRRDLWHAADQRSQFQARSVGGLRRLAVDESVEAARICRSMPKSTRA